MLTADITPLCKSTKRHLQSQVQFIYTGLVPPACFCREESRQSPFESLLTRDPESRSQPSHPPRTPIPRQKLSICHNMQSFSPFLHFASGYILTAILWRSSRSGKAWRQWVLKPIIMLCTWSITLLSYSSLLTVPPAAAPVHRDLHQCLGRAAQWLEHSHSQQLLRTVNFIFALQPGVCYHFLLQLTPHWLAENIPVICYLRQRNTLKTLNTGFLVSMFPFLIFFVFNLEEHLLKKTWNRPHIYTRAK